MKKYIALLSVYLLCIAGSSHAMEVSGAGSTAAALLYAKWGQAYEKRAGTRLIYQAVGSSAGISKVKENAVNFGATDAPMSAADREKNGLMMFPTVISGVVPFVNLPGVKAGELRLTGDLLSGIYTGRITKWNDPDIVAENPNLALPNQTIIPIARSDGSGTTFTLTDYFTRVSPEWKEKFGRNFAIPWPSHVTTAKGTSDLIATVKKTSGSIGYADYGYVIEHNLSYTLLKNREGRYARPNALSFRMALARSDWERTGNFEEMLTNKPGIGTWPITGSTYILMPKNAAPSERTIEVVRFFTWAFMEGDLIAESLDYVRLPNAVQARVYQELVSLGGGNMRALSMPTR